MFNSLVDYSANALGDTFSGLSFAEAVELVMDFIPGVSNLKAGYEFATWETLFSGHEFDETERALVGASIILGPVGKAGIKTGKLATSVVRSSDEAADLFGASSQLSKADNLVSGGGVANKPISVDEALDKASDFLKRDVPIRSIDGKTGVQFVQEFTENGQKITKRVGFDLNPNSSHVKQLGPHLNLQTQLNGKIQKKGILKDPHIPIDPKTIREGDY